MSGSLNRADVLVYFHELTERCPPHGYVGLEWCKRSGRVWGKWWEREFQSLGADRSDNFFEGLVVPAEVGIHRSIAAKVNPSHSLERLSFVHLLPYQLPVHRNEYETNLPCRASRSQSQASPSTPRSAFEYIPVVALNPWSQT